MLVNAENLKAGQTFQVLYEKRWSNKITVKETSCLDFGLAHFLVLTTTGKTKLLKREQIVKVVG